jgi:hypothetical protein
MNTFVIFARSDSPFARIRILVALLIASCTTLSVQKIDTDFDGMKTALERTAKAGGTLRILTVHGMCTTSGGYSQNLINGLATRLKVESEGNARHVDIKRNGITYGGITINDFSSPDSRGSIRVYELLWSPTTAHIKTSTFAYDNSFAPERVPVNRQLKATLMDDCLADPVLYVGNYRSQMQFPVMRGINELLKDFASNDELVIVTESLGSYMTFDTLVAMSKGESIYGEHSWSENRVSSLIAHTNYIFMLANQLPLLELSERASSPNKKTSVQSLKNIVQRRSEILRARRFPSLNLRLVAFSDPNDLLGYPLESSDVPSNVSFSNVIISVERSAILGVFAWPITAHTGFDKSAKALDLLVFGYSGKE